MKVPFSGSSSSNRSSKKKTSVSPTGRFRGEFNLFFRCGIVEKKDGTFLIETGQVVPFDLAQAQACQSVQGGNVQAAPPILCYSAQRTSVGEESIVMEG